MNNLKQPDREFPLTNDRGFINIGNHPSNDVIVDGERVQPFHAMIDCRQEPYLLLPLSADSEIWVNDQSVSGRQAVVLHGDETIQFSSHNLKFTPPTNGNPASLVVTNTLSGTGVIDEGYRQMNAQPAQLPTTAVVGLKPGEDILDEFIVASLAEDSATVDVDMTATYLLTVANGSTIVSTFNVQVEGVPDEWVIVSPQNVNLNEGSRAEITIGITPPRKNTSTAGKHPLRLIISSFNHPGRQTILHANLEINPYYEYVIGEITPGRKRIAYHHQAGEVKMQVSNRGNSDAAFVLSARDEEEGCRFQFAGEDGLKQTGQVQVTLPAGETRQIPVYVSPIKRRIISWRSPQYPFRVAVTQPQSATQSLFTLGTAIARPLIGILGILIMLMCIAALIGYAFTPRIIAFSADDNAVSVGGSTTLRWNVPFLTHDLQLVGLADAKPLTASQGSLLVYPDKTVNTYTLNATTWLWNIFGLKPKTQSFTVLSVPSDPVVNTFTLSKTEGVLFGDQVLLRWSVDNASKAQMTVNGVTEVLEDKAGFNGEKPILVTKDTLVYLEAFNALSSKARSLFFKASPPEIKIDRFETSLQTVYTGAPVTIYWDVTGAGMDQGGTVTISGFEGVLPNKGELTFFPEQSMEFVLTATNRTLRETKILPIGVLEPGQPPPLPVINFFTAAPTTIVGPGEVELAWSVSGIYTDISLANGSAVIESGLNAQGFRSMKVNTSGTYILTATQSGKSVGANLQITVNPAMKAPKLKVLSVVPGPTLQMGDLSAVTVDVAKPAASDPPPTGTVIVTDGVSSCQITLPKTSCDLVFQKAGLKSIVATYQGDPNFLSAEATFAEAVDVTGITNSLATGVRNPNQTDNSKFEYGESLDLTVSMQGVKTNFKPDGIIHVTKYFCDSNKDNCVLAVEQPAENVHQFSPQENGAYTFSQLLPLENMEGSVKLQIDFDTDSFYNPSSSTQYVIIDPSTKSPVSISSIQASLATNVYTLTVSDQNIFGYYSAPTGTVSLTATHSDGTRISCPAATLVPVVDDPNRTSSASCSISPSKRGAWTLSATYDPGEADLTHKSQVTPAGNITTTADAYITLSANSPVLYTGVTNQIKVNITDGMGAPVTRGTVIYTYNNATSSCSLVGTDWVCTAIKPVEDITLPITFGFTPDPTDQLFMGPETAIFLNLVNSSQTAVGTLAPVNTIITPPPYIPGIQYEFRAFVTSLEVGGVPPSTGSVVVKLVDATAECDSVSTREFSLPIGNSGIADGYIVFSASDDGKKVCYQFEGNSGYLASGQATAGNLSVKKLQTSTSNFRPVTPSITPPPYIPGLNYEFRANVSNGETGGGNPPTSGFVNAKLINSTNTCLVPSDRSFKLVVDETGVADGVFSFVGEDSAINKLCYQFEGNATFASSDWQEVIIPIRKLSTTVGYLETVNAAAKAPPFLPLITYTMKTTVADEKGIPITSGVVTVKLINSSDCTVSSDRSFNMTVESGGIAKGDFTYLSTDANKSVCYRYEGNSLHTPSEWTTLPNLDVRGININVNGLKTVSAVIAPPPYLPATAYDFQAKVLNVSGGSSPTIGSVLVEVISKPENCGSATPIEEFSLSVGENGIASGSFTFQDSDIGDRKACYQFTGISYYNTSDWNSTPLEIRKLNTTVGTLKVTNTNPTPPPFIPEVDYQFQTQVGVEAGSNPTVGTVTAKLVSGTDCATAASLHDFTLTVGQNGLATGTVAFVDADLGLKNVCYRYAGEGNFAPSPWVMMPNLNINRFSSSVSDLKVINASLAPPPYLPGVNYQFQAKVSGGTGPTPITGTVSVKLISGTADKCGTTASTHEFSLSMGDPGLATGYVTFLDADIGSKTACYQYTGSVYNNSSTWQSATLDIRKFNTNVTDLKVVNATLAPPPYLPGTNYQFQVKVVNTGGGSPPTVGSVLVKLITGADCPLATDLTTIEEFSLLVGENGIASGQFSFQDSDIGSRKACYQYSSNAYYNASDWNSTQLEIRKLNTTVGVLKSTNTNPTPPPFIPEVEYQFQTQVGVEAGSTPTVGTVTAKIINGTDCATASSLHDFTLTVGQNGLATGTAAFVDADLGLKNVCYRYAGEGNFAPSPWVMTTLTISRFTPSVSDLKVISSATFTPPPYVPGINYQFQAKVVNAGGGNPPTVGSVLVKLITGADCPLATDLTTIEEFSLTVGENGIAAGEFTFQDSDIGSRKACYQYTKTASYNASDWNSTMLDIRKLNTTVGVLKSNNTNPTPPPYIPGVNYQFQTQVGVEMGSNPTVGIVNAILITGNSCPTTEPAPSADFTLTVGQNGLAIGTVAFEDTLLGDKKVCYRYAGEGNFAPSPWVMTTLTISRFTPAVSDLKVIGTTVLTPPPYIPGISYQFQAKVTGGTGPIPTTGTINVKLISGTACSTATSTHEFSLSVGDGGVATGYVTFLDADIGIMTACYQYTGSANYISSTWQTTPLEIRRLSTSVSGLTVINAALTPPPYIPGTNYQFQARVASSVGFAAPETGTIDVYLISGTDCTTINTSSTTHNFTLAVSDNGVASGNFTFQNSDTASKSACYLYSGSDYYSPSTWQKISLEARLLTTTVSDLKAINFTIAPPPYIPEMLYHFQAKVTPETGNPPATGTMTVKVITGTNCATTTSTSQFTMAVGEGGIATGDFTILTVDTGDKYACYRFETTGPFDTSSWQSIPLTIRKLATKISDILTDGNKFPPSTGVTLGTAYTFTTTVSETEGKNTTIAEDGTVTLDLILATSTCGATSLINPAIVLTVGTDGLATSTPYTFPDNLNDSYVFCGKFTGDSTHAASGYFRGNTFTIKKRATLASALAPAPPTGGFTAGTVYNYTATVADNEGGSTPPTPDGGTVNLYLVPSTTLVTGCSTTTLLGSLTVDNGAASGPITFTNTLADGVSRKICYRFTGSGQHGMSAWVLYPTAFVVKRQPTFSTVPGDADLVATEDTSIAADQTVITLTLKDAKGIDNTKLKLVDSSGNTVCAGTTGTGSSGRFDCSLPTITSTTTGGFDYVTAVWKIAFKDSESLTITPRFAGDTKHFAVDGTTFTLRSRYSIVWITGTMQWTQVTGTTLVSYLAGEADQMTTTFSGYYKFNKFSNHTYDSTDFAGEVLPAAKIGPAGSCSFENKTYSGDNAVKVTCINVGILDAKLTKIKLNITPPSASSDDYTGDFTSPELTGIDVKANISEASVVGEVGGPSVQLGCDGDYVTFSIAGNAQEGVTDFLDTLGKFRIAMGCEQQGGVDDNEWKVYILPFMVNNFLFPGNATLTSHTYDPVTGAFTALITGADGGCSFEDKAYKYANKLRIGLYSGYTQPSNHASGKNEPAVDLDSYIPDLNLPTNTTGYEYFYDVGPIISADGLWRRCSAGGLKSSLDVEW